MKKNKNTLVWQLTNQGEPEKILDTDRTFAQRVISIGSYLDKVKAKLGSSPLLVSEPAISCSETVRDPIFDLFFRRVRCAVA